MSIIYCEKTDTGRDARIDDDGMLEMTESYVVEVDDPTDDGAAVLRASCLPLRGDVHPLVPNLQAINMESRQRPGTLVVWDIYVYYRQVGILIFSNPLLEPPQIQYGTVRTREPYDFDVNGVPIANSAGVPFDPPLERDVTRPTLIYTRNEPDYILGDFVPFYDGVNEHWFFQAAPGQAKLMNVVGRGPFERNGIQYYQVTYEFHFRRDPWHIEQILDRGIDELVDVDAGPEIKLVLRPITRQMVQTQQGAAVVTGDPSPSTLTTTKDIPITEPVFLNGQGRILGRDAHGDPLPPFVLNAQPYNLVDFNDFPFGQLIENWYDPTGGAGV